jgi:thiaminase
VLRLDGGEKMGEWKQTFDRIMDQLYNHPEEMRAKLLKKYETSTELEPRPMTAIELLRSLH